MMKRITAMLIMVLLLPAVLLGATETGNKGTELEIKAYKMGGDNYGKIIITSAVPGALYEIGSIDNPEGTPSSIDITSRLEQLFGNTDAVPSVFNERVVFSYRVAGTEAGTYTIRLTFGEFSHDGSGSSINASYALGNTNYVFSRSSNTTSAEGYTIKDDSRTRGVIQQKNSGSASWTVSQGCTEEWIVRGAIAMTINESSYINAAYGRHSATVQVTYEVN